MAETKTHTVGEANNPAQVELEKDRSLAERLLQEKNAEELFNLYEKAVSQRGEAFTLVATICEHYVGSKNMPLYEPRQNVVLAMEHVALAAIALAREIAIKSKNGAK